MKTLIKGPRKCRRRGAAAVEFAVTAPVFLLLVFGIIELGRVMMVKNALTNAAREGCRTAVLATTMDTNRVQASVSRYVDGVLSFARVTVDITPKSGWEAIDSGTDVQVTLSVPYSQVTWLPFGSLVGNAQLQSSAIQQRE